jgi:hypothetical protein
MNLDVLILIALEQNNSSEWQQFLRLEIMQKIGLLFAQEVNQPAPVKIPLNVGGR